jgi:tryptophan-rich sensory protein
MPVSSVLALVGFVGLCLLVGAVGGSVTAPAIRVWYPSLTAPPGTPPNWLFAPVWTVLYVMIGTAAWMVWRRRGASRQVRLWGWQLAANALWVPAFFGLHSPRLAMAVMIAVLVLTALTIRAFLPVRRTAAWLMIPYAAWSVYAAYLNAGFWFLNHV